jgi:GMC oxidoreductase/Periplasmic binding protein domain
MDAGIPVVVQGTALGPKQTTDPQVSGIVGSAVTLSTTNGVAAADLTNRACQKASANPCKVIYLFGPVAFDYASITRKTFKDTVKAKYPNLRVVAEAAANFDPDTAASQARQLLQVHPDVNVVVNDCDPCAVATEKVVSDLHKDKIITVGAGGSKVGVDAIKAGKQFRRHGDPARDRGQGGDADGDQGCAQARPRRHHDRRDQGPQPGSARSSTQRTSASTRPSGESRRRVLGARDPQALRRGRGARRREHRRRGRRDPRAGRRTAPASRRWARSSPAPSRPTRARSASTASRSATARRATRSAMASGSSSRGSRWPPTCRCSTTSSSASSSGSRGLVDRARQRGRLAELAERIGFRERPSAAVRTLRTADQQKVEILRQLVRDTRLIVMPMYDREWMDGPQDAYTIQGGLIRTLSRGSIRLRSADPTAPPLMDPRALTAAGDLDALAASVQLAREIGRQPALAEWTADELYPGPEVRTRDALRDYVRRVAVSYHHEVGTCRMGSDEHAVVDPELRVRGVDGLRVADASIMPFATTGNTHAPALMIGARAALMMLGSNTR